MLRISYFALFCFNSTEISEWILRSEWLPFVELQITSIYISKRAQARTCQGTTIFHLVCTKFYQIVTTKRILRVDDRWHSLPVFIFIVSHFVPAIHQKANHRQNDLTRKINLWNVVAHIHKNIFNILCVRRHKIFLLRSIKPRKPLLAYSHFTSILDKAQKFFSIYFMLCLMT